MYCLFGGGRGLILPLVTPRRLTDFLPSYDDHYQVLNILCERWAHGAHQYLVKWQHHRVRNDHIQVLTSAPLSYTARE